jgi:hypothetical protein
MPLHREDEMEEVDPDSDEENSLLSRLPRNWAIYTAAALVLLFIVWHFAAGKKTPAGTVQTSTPPAVAASSNTPTQPVQVVVHHVNQAAQPETPQPTSAMVEAANAVSAPASLAPSIPGWHVIAYTFHRQDQAQSRANAIAAKHPSLHPQVYSPTGGSPYLVSLGGTLSEREAQQLVRTARHEGLPRDTFARNYRR